MKNEMTPTERAFLIGMRMGRGEALRSRDVANVSGITPRAASRAMNRFSRVAPLHRGDDFFWRVLPAKSKDNAK